MRPSDGYWCTRRGYNVHYAAQMYEIDATDDSITVYAACHAIRSRGDTLGGPMLTIRFTSPLENCIKVTIDHYEGALHPGPFFELSEDSGFRPTVQKRPDGCWSPPSSTRRASAVSISRPAAPGRISRPAKTSPAAVGMSGSTTISAFPFTPDPTPSSPTGTSSAPPTTTTPTA